MPRAGVQNVAHLVRRGAMTMQNPVRALGVSFLLAA